MTGETLIFCFLSELFSGSSSNGVSSGSFYSTFLSTFFYYSTFNYFSSSSVVSYFFSRSCVASSVTSFLLVAITTRYHTYCENNSER